MSHKSHRKQTKKRKERLRVNKSTNENPNTGKKITEEMRMKARMEETGE